jgi:hypothetical protein
MFSTNKKSSISSISPLTSKNYWLWANDIKSWLQLNGLWCLVSGQEKKPTPKPEVRDSQGQVITSVVAVDEDKLERWEIKAERAAGVLKTAITHDVKVSLGTVRTILLRFGIFWRPLSLNRGLPLTSMPTTPSFSSRKMTLDSLINKMSTLHQGHQVSFPLIRETHLALKCTRCSLELS